MTTTVGRSSRTSAVQSSVAGEAQLAKSIDEVKRRNRSGKVGSISVRFRAKRDGRTVELSPGRALKAFLAGDKVSATAVAFRHFKPSHKLLGDGRVARVKVQNSEVREFNLEGRGKETAESFAKWIDKQLAKPTVEKGSSSPRSRHPTKM